jgi:hypothetical protein
MSAIGGKSRHWQSDRTHHSDIDRLRHRRFLTPLDQAAQIQ